MSWKREYIKDKYGRITGSKLVRVNVVELVKQEEAIKTIPITITAVPITYTPARMQEEWTEEKPTEIYPIEVVNGIIEIDASNFPEGATFASEIEIEGEEDISEAD